MVLPMSYSLDVGMDWHSLAQTLHDIVSFMAIDQDFSKLKDENHRKKRILPYSMIVNPR